MKERHIKYFVLLSFMLLITVPMGFAWLAGHLHEPLETEQEYLLDVPRGSSLFSVIRRLSADGLLGEPSEARLRRMAVRVYAFTNEDARHIHAGEYRIRPGENLSMLLDKLENGDVIQRAFTIVEGSTFRDIRRQFASAAGLTLVTENLSDRQIMSELGRPDRHPEGWFSPDTYFYTRGETDLALLGRALARQETILEKAWAQRAEGLPYSDPYDALIMASIVERETGVPEERDQIAGVFVSRLEKGMRLQTDPTVIYGMGERYQGRIRSADLREATPYNTYVIAGMPPTPIAMPGAAAIQAAVNPKRTAALFFVARGDGSHVFSETLREHQEAVRRYQLNRREDYRSSPAPLPVPDVEQP
ncbi:aminodeoxychorismate lyase [Isoalcanivorax pacificus W11-5]|uniref:Endolytic murein transglycosylase n=1 Tax=Isoalcanivorax pacificus W11-5 TaxID=391936 RepID=A0A0B4XIL5_9GAMM|nr:endolytic transglycosylase MltG [Isoalcanivorax pacificus]AJD48104.1 aminodeoxychorismate lyase [Isoalcanivorax pacificus W11-5]